VQDHGHFYLKRGTVAVSERGMKELVMHGLKMQRSDNKHYHQQAQPD
jgi:hypothetical protein